MPCFSRGQNRCNCILPVCNRQPTIIRNPIPTPTVLPTLGAITIGPTEPIDIDGIIPLTTIYFNKSAGINLNDDGTFSLSYGVYQVSYSASEVSTTTGTFGLGATLNGETLIQSQSHTTVLAVNETVFLSKTFVVEVTSLNSILALINLSSHLASLSDVTVTITKIG